VLGLLCEQQSHGWRLVTALRPTGEIGKVWTSPRARVYRAITQLTEQGLIAKNGVEESALGPSRTLLGATPAGRRALTRWLETPVEHLRDVRSVLLLKLLLLDRLGRDPTGLLDAQRQTFAGLAESLRSRVDSTDGFDRTLALWRHTTAEAALGFLERLAR
jgi:DNA-binding PadR family transcriptional regulator